MQKKRCFSFIILILIFASISFSGCSLGNNSKKPLLKVVLTAGIINIDEFGVIHALSAGVVTVTGKTEYGISTAFTVTVIDPDFIIKLGDVNRNDVIDAVDLVRLKKYLVGITSLMRKGIEAADIDENEIVDAMDLLLLRKILLGEK